MWRSVQLLRAGFTISAIRRPLQFSFIWRELGVNQHINYCESKNVTAIRGQH